MRHADILGIADPNLERAKVSAECCRALRLGDPHVYGRVAELVRDRNIDALWICAPNYTRLQVMREIAAAVKAGDSAMIGIACEKPEEIVWVVSMKIVI